MKKLVFVFVLSLVTCSFGAFAQIKVASNGYVGINNTSPGYNLDVNGQRFRAYYSSYQPFILDVYHSDPRITSGSSIVFYKTDATGFIDVQCRTLYQYSDMNAKENITPLGDEKSPATDTNIAKIEKLKGVNYTWKDDKDKKIQVGFLAQDVESVIPEAVITNDSTKVKSMAYTAIIPYLVEAMKEQQAQIEELKKLLNK